MSDTTSRSGFGTGMATSVAESSFIKALSLSDTTMLVAGAMIGSGPFALRKTQPHARRVYRAVGYPALPALYMLLARAVAVILLPSAETRTQALAGLLMAFIGIPVYLIWRGTAGNTARDTD